MTQIKLVVNVLSDGSLAWDVFVGDQCFHCYTERDAVVFASTVAAAIDLYTINEAKIVAGL